MSNKRIGVVIVSYGHEQDVANLVDTFADQLKTGDRVVVVDNRKPWVLKDAVGSAWKTRRRDHQPRQRWFRRWLQRGRSAHRG